MKLRVYVLALLVLGALVGTAHHVVVAEDEAPAAEGEAIEEAEVYEYEVGPFTVLEWEGASGQWCTSLGKTGDALAGVALSCVR